MTDDVLSSLNPGESKPPAGSDLLSTLVGDGKKFKTVEDLAKAKSESDNFIEQLKAENADVRKALKEAEEKAAQGGTLNDLIERIEKATGQNGNPAGTLSREDIEKLVDNSLSKRDTKRERAANRASTNADLLKKFGGDGAKAAAFIKEKSVAMGLAPAILTEIAETTPDAFRELFGLGKTERTPPPGILPVGRTADAGGPGPGTDERGKSYYSKLRKELGHKYFEPKIQQQMMADRRRLGDRYNQL